jgi:hypothetical protein
MTAAKDEDEQQEQPNESNYWSSTYTHVEKLEEKRVFLRVLMKKGGEGRKHGQWVCVCVV